METKYYSLQRKYKIMFQLIKKYYYKQPNF